VRSADPGSASSSPTAIADVDDYGEEDIEGLYVRRFKTDVAALLARRIPKREVQVAHAHASPAEEAAYDALTALTFHTLDRRTGGGAMLFRTTLEKALFSSPAACRETVGERVKRLRRRQAGREAAGDAAAALALAQDIAALERFDTELAAVTDEDFRKLGKLCEVLRERWRWSPRRTRDRLVIFTERKVGRGAAFPGLSVLASPGPSPEHGSGVALPGLTTLASPSPPPCRGGLPAGQVGHTRSSCTRASGGWRPTRAGTAPCVCWGAPVQGRRS